MKIRATIEISMPEGDFVDIAYVLKGMVDYHSSRASVTLIELNYDRVLDEDDYRLDSKRFTSPKQEASSETPNSEPDKKPETPIAIPSSKSIELSF